MTNEQLPTTFTVDGVEYLTDSLTEKGKEILTTIDIIGREMSDLQAKFKVAEIARGAVGKELAEEVQNFTKVEPEAE